MKNEKHTEQPPPVVFWDFHITNLLGVFVANAMNLLSGSFSSSHPFLGRITRVNGAATLPLDWEGVSVHAETFHLSSRAKAAPTGFATLLPGPNLSRLGDEIFVKPL